MHLGMLLCLVHVWPQVLDTDHSGFRAKKGFGVLKKFRVQGSNMGLGLRAYKIRFRA